MTTPTHIIIARTAVQNGKTTHADVRPRDGATWQAIRVPHGDGPEFDAFCEERGWHPLGSERRAWCPDIQSYLRGDNAIIIGEDGLPALGYVNWQD